MKKYISVQKGFTLMELLVSIAIFSIIAVLMSNIVLSMAKVSLDSERRTDILNLLDSTSAIIKNDMRAASSLQVINGTGGTKLCRNTVSGDYYRLAIRNDILVWEKGADCNAAANANEDIILTTNSIFAVQSISISQATDSLSGNANNLIYVMVEVCDKHPVPNRRIFDCDRDNPYRYYFGISSRSVATPTPTP